MPADGQTPHRRHAPGLGSRAAAVGLAVAVCLFGVRAGTGSAGGADASGYVSQARLWRGGALAMAAPLAARSPWPDATWTFAPLGYRPGRSPGELVPTYPPGLPWLMALASAPGWSGAVFVVVPLAGGLAVWFTFLLGRRLGSPLGGLLAGALVASSPVFLFQLLQPMSDVPVTAAWLGAFVLAFGRRPGWAGVVAGLAVAIRPNLAPLAVPVALAALATTPPARAIARFASGVIPWLAIVAALHTRWYGGPLQSGYGSMAEIFAAANVVENARRYAGWFIAHESPLLLAALIAPVAWFSRAGPALEVRRWPEAILAVTALVVIALYLPYATFDDWWYLRFLLPALAPVAVLAVRGATIALAALPARFARLALVVVVLAAIAGSLSRARSAGVFDLPSLERRYPFVGTWVAQHTPASAVLLSMQHSGSVAHYAGRPVLRWDLLAVDWLDRAIEDLRARGHSPLVLVEAWEEPQFRARFGPSQSYGRLDWPPAATFAAPVAVRLYDPADRERYLRGEAIESIRVIDRTGR